MRNYWIRILHLQSIRETFEELLDKDTSVTIHQGNFRKLAIEMYKVKHILSPLQEVFVEHMNKYELRKKRWGLPNTRNVNYGNETIRYRGPKTWDFLPIDIKQSESLDIFKSKIKNWKPQGCECRSAVIRQNAVSHI